MTTFYPSRHLKWCSPLIVSLTLMACGGSNDDRKPPSVEKPIASPSASPTASPTTSPTASPTASPQPTPTPTAEPSSSPTPEPTPQCTPPVPVDLKITSFKENDLIDGDKPWKVSSTHLGVKGSKLYIDGTFVSVATTEIPSSTTIESIWESDKIPAMANVAPGKHEIKVEVFTTCILGGEQSVNIRLNGTIGLPRIAVNAGGGKVTTVDGIVFEADQGFAGGSEFTIPDKSKDILNTEDDELYQTERTGTFKYSLPISNDTYQLELLFAEIYHKAEEKRLFKIDVEGEERVAELDLVKTAQAFTAYILPFNDLAITDGTLDFGITTIKDQGKISAFRLNSPGIAWDDEDSDGVVNVSDSCPFTLAADVDNIMENGCKRPPPDDDKDSVANTDDTCPDTPASELVDASGCSLSQKDSDGDAVSDDLDLCDSTPAGETVNAQGCAAGESDIITKPFIEKDGIVAVELESAVFPSGWTRRSGSQSLGNGFLEYTGPDKFNEPGTSLISFKVSISNPGSYRVIWRSSIREGMSSTDFNDSWLKILANSFYGKKGDGIVCPRGHDTTMNACVGKDPEGGGKDGWFKVYRSGGNPVSDWIWITSTSDNDAHAVFADFNSAGEYEVQVSARSKAHAIDRIVLYRSDNADKNVTLDAASALSLPESAR